MKLEMMLEMQGLLKLEQQRPVKKLEILRRRGSREGVGGQERRGQRKRFLLKVEMPKQKQKGRRQK